MKNDAPINHCRIARVKLKRNGATVTILPTRHQESRFVETLVWLLDQVRQGKVRSYGIAARLEKPDGETASYTTVEIYPDGDTLDRAILERNLNRCLRRVYEMNDAAETWQAEGPQ